MEPADISYFLFDFLLLTFPFTPTPYNDLPSSSSLPF